MDKVVLQKYIADSGYCSRRRATELIRAGKVKVNGETAEPGTKVFPNDEVWIGRQRIEPETEKIYIIINKPDGYVCTNRKFKGEKNVFDLLVDRSGREDKLKQRLFVVGRLDKNSRGLVLLTNDGEFAQRVMHPKFEHEKSYVVKIQETPLRSSSYAGQARYKKQGYNKIITNLIKGIEIDGKILKAKRAKYLGDNKFKVVLTQGVKRQIRLMFEALGYQVADLQRTRIGCKQCGIELGDLRCGEWRKLKISEIEKLK